MAGLPTRARMFLFLVWTGGAVCFAAGMFPWHSGNRWLFGSYLVLTALASAFKTVLPGLEGTVSANDVFFLVGVCTMTLSETLALALIPTAVQCFWRRQKRLGIIHFAFNLSQVALAITAAFLVYQLFLNRIFYGRAPLALLIAAIVYFLVNTLSVATMVALADGTSIKTKWTTGYWWTFPYCLIGAAIAGVIQLVNRIAGWEMSILVLPAIYAIYRSYRMQSGRWEDEKRHLQDIAALHMRTIETLALAIEAKDHTTGDHLQRVRVYAMELGKDLGLSPSELQALQAASVLHDIGKLAVPESIISKPGKLTPEEFEKMKIHPIVGAEIVEQVRFPYPVAPIVRCHHEKWDGSGYPEGIAGEAIPIGARILSAVDCLDALASDRQYRRALPLDEAMAMVVAGTGTSFDPRVVSVLHRRYVELERMAKELPPQVPAKLSTELKVKRGSRPAAGFAQESETSDPILRISFARKQCDEIIQISHRSGPLIGMEEIGALISLRLKHIVGYDAFALYYLNDGVLVPAFVTGRNSEVLASLRIPLGEGLSGWVAQNRHLILNADPSVEPGYLNNPTEGSLRSALVVPLGGQSECSAVLALYRTGPDAFTADDLRVLGAIRVNLETAVHEAHRGKVFEASSPS